MGLILRKILSPSTVQKQQLQVPWADPGFFLGGGALVSCSTSTPINHIIFCVQNTSCIRKPQVISGGGGRWGSGHPPHPPPRSTPESLFKKSTIPKLKMLGPLCKQTVTEDRLQNSVKIYSFYFKAQQR